VRPGARIADNAADLVKGSDEDGDRRMSGQDLDSDVSVGKRRKPRRWIVEVAHSWINRFRRLLVRWEKKASNYLSLLYFACAIICWRKCEV